MALKDDYKLYEEAFVVFRKINQPLDAIKVLMNKLNALERAADFAEKVNRSDVWSELALYYLKEKLFVEAIDCFIKANNPKHYEEVIELNQEVQNFDKLLEYFNMVRKMKKVMEIDNEYIYSLARLDRLQDIESFIKNPNSADLARTGDKLYNEGLYKAAKILFVKLKQNSKIASCLVNLG